MKHYDLLLLQTALLHLHRQTVADPPAFHTAVLHMPTSQQICHMAGTELSEIIIKKVWNFK